MNKYIEILFKYIRILYNYIKKDFLFSFIFITIIIIISYFIFKDIKIGSNTIESFGFFTIISFHPIFWIARFWKRRKNNSGLMIFFLLWIIVMGIFTIYWLCNKNYLICSCQYMRWINNEENEQYLSLFNILGFSFVYGIISTLSCIIGLKIKITSDRNQILSLFKSAFIFISIAVVVYLFLFERIREVKASGISFQFDPFLMSFLLLSIIISFLYIILGYYSKYIINGYFCRYTKVDPFAFFISLGLSFSIGYTFSVFVLEFEREIHSLPTHWVFLCVWTMVLSNFSLYIVNNEYNISEYIKKILKV